MNLPRFIASKLSDRHDGRRSVSRPAVRIATAGVAVGLAVMIVSVSVVLGFKHTIRDKVIGMASHLAVSTYSQLHGGDQQPAIITDSLILRLQRTDGVAHTQRYALAQGVLKTESDFLGVALKGIAEDYDTTFISQHIVSGHMPAIAPSDHDPSTPAQPQLLISSLMARQLQLATNDRIFAYFFDGSGMRLRRFTIAGIYETNLTQYDKAICYTDLHTAQRLNGWSGSQLSGLEIAVSDFNRLDIIADSLRSTLRYSQPMPLTAATVKELTPQIFAWLDLLDLNVWIILALMAAVAAVTIVSGLLIVILERTTMIGLLKALGARNTTIRHIFLHYAAHIVGRGMLWGNAIGIAITLLQRYTGIIQLDPTTYYVAAVPTELHLPLIIAINAATLLATLLAATAPTLLISHITPAKAMRE